MPTDRKTLSNARQLRQSMTPAEAILWRRLRDRRFANFKFRRQHPLGPFIADFFCHQCKLIVELDGDSHVGKETKDKQRTSALEACGYLVLRFWNPQVYDELESVLDTIYLHCSERARCERDQWMGASLVEGESLSPSPGLRPPSPAKPGEGL